MDVLVYGLGGASKSILNSLISCKNIYVANRTEEKTTEILDENNSLKRYNGESLDLVISCAQTLDLNTSKYFEHLTLTKGSILYDINYSNQTNMIFSDLSIVDKTNLYNGTGMLVEQAAQCFELWFNKKPEVEKIKNRLNEEL